MPRAALRLRRGLPPQLKGAGLGAPPARDESQSEAKTRPQHVVMKAQPIPFSVHIARTAPSTTQLQTPPVHVDSTACPVHVPEQLQSPAGSPVHESVVHISELQTATAL